MQIVDPETIVNGLTPEGNSVLKCMGCKTIYDKGLPPQIGQDDSQFLCEGCQTKLNRAALEVVAPVVGFDTTES